MSMNIREELLREHSKAQTLKIVHYINNDQQKFDELMYLFMNDVYRVTQRAAWVVSHCAEFHPSLVEKHLRPMLENLQNPVHVAVKRNTVRVLQDIELPEELLGLAATICLDFLADPQEAIAVKAFSMQVVYNICLKEPDLAGELKLILEDLLPHASSGVKNRATKILKKLQKLSFN